MKERKGINILIIFIIFVLIIFGIYFYYKFYGISNTLLNNKDKEAGDLITKVSELYILPNGEIPTIADVSDPAASFFKSAQVGDKVLIFPIAGKAVVYRPSVNKIVDVVLVKVEVKK